jgi:hypothetical protein
MHLGLTREGDYREGRTQRQAFDEAFVGGGIPAEFVPQSLRPFGREVAPSLRAAVA